MIVFIISFASNQYLSFPPEGFTLKWYELRPAESTFMNGMKVSLIVAAIVTLIVLVLGVPAALALDRFEFRVKGAIQSFFLSPLLIPSIVLALGLVLLFAPRGGPTPTRALSLATWPSPFPLSSERR
ncbi:ABC transporter permease [Arthrobacter sp. GCM10027362]|uniref:ABC transporter permease n=1 Tax=Arthrobacter sp. GCM10027362 TaxID=3273379 RepID=UPI003624F015